MSGLGKYGAQSGVDAITMECRLGGGFAAHVL